VIIAQSFSNIVVFCYRFYLNASRIVFCLVFATLTHAK